MDTDMDTETKFVTFGCWNEDCCDKDTPVFKVLNKINNEDSDANFFIVTGDNYYPKKDKKNGKKVTDKTQLSTSFRLLRKKLLRKEDKELFLLLGNHDVEKTIQEGEGEREEEANCYVTKREILFAETSLKKKRINFPKELVMFKKIGEHTLIIMIDTNIYSGEDLTCYEWIERREGEIMEDFRTKLQDLQQEKIVNILQKEKYKNIIVCGHNPLIGFKNQKVKDENGKIKGGIDTCHEKLYELLFSLQEHGESFYYLCADIHNYQRGTVIIRSGPGTEKMEINQHIVGIGGTELDENYNEGYNPAFKKKDDVQIGIVEASIQIGKYNINYTIQEHFSEHGYLVVKIRDIDHSVIFEIKTIEEEIISAGKSKIRTRSRTRKSRRRRTRRRSIITY